MTRAATHAVVAGRREWRGRLLAEAARFVAHLDPSLQVRRAVVFGSVARGDFHDESDVDLLVVAARLPTLYPDRLSAVGYPDGSRVAPVVWTPAEHDAQRRRGNLVAVETDELGVWGGGLGAWPFARASAPGQARPARRPAVQRGPQGRRSLSAQ